MKIKHASHIKVSNCLREIMSKLDHLYKSVCNKIKYYQVVVTNFINNSKLLGKFASVGVSNVRRDLKRVERGYLLSISPQQIYEINSLGLWGLITLNATIPED
jgi:hypothetical protein